MTVADTDIVEAEVVPSALDIRESISRARTHLEMAADEIVWQIANRAWDPDALSSATYELSRATERVERLGDDDRLARNAETGARHLGDICRREGRQLIPEVK